MPSTIPASLVFAVLAAAILVHFSRRNNFKRPPGPKPLPFIGNLLDVPREETWKTFAEWRGKYDSDIIALTVFGQHTYIVSDWEMVQELFVKRAAIYSSRPRLPMIAEVQGYDWMFSLMPYGPIWREHRKMFHKEIKSLDNDSHYAHALRDVRTLIKSLAESPENYREHVRQSFGSSPQSNWYQASVYDFDPSMTTSIILDTAYGLETQPKNDPYVKIVEDSVDGILATGVSGTYLVDLLPGLQKIPFVEWLPGVFGRWKRDGMRWKKYGEDLLGVPFKKAKENYTGTGKACATSKALEEINHLDGPELEHELTVLKQMLGQSFADFEYFHHICARHGSLPRRYKEGSGSRRQVIGKDKLATYDDYDSLPYIHAVVQETLRWQPVPPLGIPHFATEDGFFGDIFIPKGTTILGNVWAMLHNESMFGPDTDKFIPERFLRAKSNSSSDRFSSKEELDLELNPSVPFPSIAFGFGRRQCPGRRMAYMTFLMAVVHVLQVFDIVRAKDKNGEDIVPEICYSTALASSQKEFPCVFRVRNKRILELLDEEVETTL